MFVKGRGGCFPRCEPFEVSHIWAGYLEGMQHAANTHTERNRDRRVKGGKEGSFYCFRASFTMNLSSRYVDLGGELYLSKCNKTRQRCVSLDKHGPAEKQKQNMHACTLTSEHNGTNSCIVWMRLLPWR